ncbi:MAG: hypothetical protein KatS3mg102_2324 [Planctomycetota bacterium]|nr:MAG: hypothetical protein KatS3mg102_2324 [Planctomycetota bacterium]
MRILDGLPGDKRLRCGRSAMQARARKRRAVRLHAGLHRTDRHLLWAALARQASYVITGDRGVLACAGAIEQCLGIRIRKPEEFLRECGVAGW